MDMDLLQLDARLAAHLDAAAKVCPSQGGHFWARSLTADGEPTDMLSIDYLRDALAKDKLLLNALRRWRDDELINLVLQDGNHRWPPEAD